jgi:hypothetical protein
MPINNFSVGRDISLTVVTASGPLGFNLLTDFQSKQDTTKKRIKGIDGKTRWVRFFDGWSGSLKLERRDSTVDDYFAQLEAAYYAGINEQAVSITDIKQEPNGGLTQYRYFGVLLDLDDAGKWSGDDTVIQSVSFVCERRIKIQ